MTGRVRITADRYVGQVGDEIQFGWTGRADCEVARHGGSWLPVVSEPFSLEGSWAQTTIAPLEPGRALWPRLEFRLGVGSDRAVVAGATWYPWAGRRFLRRVGAWAEYQAVDVLSESYPWSLGESETTRDGRMAGGVAVRW